MTTYQKTNAAAGSTQEASRCGTPPRPILRAVGAAASPSSDDGRLDVKFSAPGVPGTGTNPEQLFAAGWSACFISAMGRCGQQDEGQTSG